MLRRTGFLAVLLSISSLLVFQVSPAFAHHKADHTQGQGNVQKADRDASDHDGDADSESDTAYTEDNDTNDNSTPNNVADDGDNYHPSGKDRSVEDGGSGTQGKAESDPDDDGRGPDRSNGGPDKPNGFGGTDRADQDGNNGCGNDDDFEDDNEGWCGKPTDTDEQVHGASEEICVEDAAMGGHSEVCDDTVEVEGGVEVREDAALPTDDGDDSVLGTLISRGTPTRAAPAAVAAAGVAAAPAGALPLTGAALVPFVIAGLGMIGGGIAIARRKS